MPAEPGPRSPVSPGVAAATPGDDARDPAPQVTAHGTLTLAAAVDAAVRGEHRGWDAIFDTLYLPVHRYARARLADSGAAEDVTQEVFTAAVTALPTLHERNEVAIRSWFLGICRHKIADRCRREMRQRRDECTATSADVADLAVNRMHAAEVVRAMDQLTEEQREVIIRRFVLDESLEDVALATARPVGAVKSMQHRALAMLRAVLHRSGVAV